MLKILLAAAAVWSLSLTAAAQPKPPALADTSFREADGDRVLQLSAVIPAPPGQIWTALTTADGWKRLGVRSAAVDFRVGGVIETNYKPGVPPGDRSNIKNRIEAYVPERILVIRNVQAPPGFPYAAEFAETATVMELAPNGPNATRLTISGVGFRSGPAFDALYAMFATGNAQTLETLRGSFAPAGLRPATGRP